VAPHIDRAAPGDPDAAAELAYDDPGTSEAAIATFGIHTMAQLDAARSRNPKGPALIGALIDAVGGPILAYEADPLFMSLLAEPSLRAWDLRCISRVQRGRTGASVEALVTAIGSHPLAGADTVVNMLWHRPRETARAVALATGDLLAVATWWVCREVYPHQRPTQRKYAPRPAHQAWVIETAARWSAATQSEPALRLFVAAHVFDFTDESQMFAVGAATCAPPAAT